MSSHFVYTVSEFRKKQRSAFEFAQAGATVVIDRYGEKFVLRHVPKESPYIPDFPQEYTAPPTTLNNKYPGGLVTVPTEKNNSEGKPSTFCPNGHFKGVSGKCLQKGCKYA